MGNAPTILSIIFFSVCSISALFGVYILVKSKNKNTRWTFVALCVSLSIWSAGFSFSISADSMQTCLLWRQASAIGWGSFFSVLLHFILQLTERKAILKKWWAYVLIYLPSAVTISAFSFYTGINSRQYNLIHTDYGWTNVAANNAWDWYYIAYYIGFMFVCLLLVWSRGRKSTDVNIKRQMRLILISSVAALVLGTATDMVFNSFFNITIPQIGPVTLLIPMTAIYYSIKRYRLLDTKPLNVEEIILNESTRSKIYDYISIAFVIGGLLEIIVEYLVESQANAQALLFSGIFCFIGFVTFIIKRLKIKDGRKDILITVTASLIIPVITFRFVDYAGVTIWAFPFILIIVSLVFNKRYVLISVALSTLVTQIIMWAIHPIISVQVNEEDYIARIGILCIAVWLSVYVNKAFVLRLKENANQIAFQRLVSEVSFDVLTINRARLDDVVNTVLKKIGLFFKADGAIINLLDLPRDNIPCCYEWSKEPGGQDPPQDGKSTISVLMEEEGAIFGSIGFDFYETPKNADEQKKMLEVFANLLMDGLKKIKAEKDIEYLAYYDHLTGLPNRTLFTDRVNQAINLARRTGKLIGIMFIDLDSFKNVNDTMGHNGGDVLIKDVADTLVSSLRKSDSVARFGGDEFLIMLNNITDLKELSKIARGIMDIFEKPFIIKKQEFFVTASSGIAVYPVDGENTETLVKNADIAMYKAKSLGKNQFILCTTDIKEEVQKNIILTNSLYRAQERGELKLLYQPQINLQAKQIIGLEALLRWNHPQMGLIRPSVFIPLAEKSGLINSVGSWVLRTACAQNREWHDMGLPRLRLSVNISVNQLKNPSFVDTVEKILLETKLEPEYLELEITESAAIREPDYIIGVLERLKKLGLSISIDDFGTEYSSLGRLKLLPIDRIKIDIQFIQGIEGSEKDQAITKIIINLAKSLGLKVTAEGVETARQLEFLNQKMCDEVQGFYYYRPLPATEIEKLLKDYTVLEEDDESASGFILNSSENG